MTIYETRRANFATWMAQNGVAFVLFEDTESRRDPSVRYFSGHPSDALLGICVDGKSVLCPWDELLAKQTAHVEKTISYTKYELNPVKAAFAMCKLMQIPKNTRIEIPSVTPYPLFLQYVDTLNTVDVLCRENGAHAFVNKMRSIKDAYEIDCYKKVSKITDDIIDIIEQKIKDGSIKTESDAALLIESECRKAGCEGTSFQTLAAGPERSFGIHCFPSYTNSPFPAQGLSILDFGVVYQGYTSDVTLTIAKGELLAGQEELITLVQKAYFAALELYKPTVSVREPHKKVAEIFARAKRVMPHSLGHSVGLEPHEEPRIRDREGNDWIFESGMIITLEPGLYDAKLGGVRLENDILITQTGNEVLTHSRIIRIEN